MDCRGTSLLSNRPTLATYSKLMSRVVWGVAVSYERGTPVFTCGLNSFAACCVPLFGNNLCKCNYAGFYNDG